MKEIKVDENGNGPCFPCINNPVPNSREAIRKLA